MHTCIHTYVRAYVRAYVRTYVRTYSTPIHVHRSADIRMHTHARMSCILACTYVRMHGCMSVLLLIRLNRACDFSFRPGSELYSRAEGSMSPAFDDPFRITVPRTLKRRPPPSPSFISQLRYCRFYQALCQRFRERSVEAYSFLPSSFPFSCSFSHSQSGSCSGSGSLSFLLSLLLSLLRSLSCSRSHSLSLSPPVSLFLSACFV